MRLHQNTVAQWTEQHIALVRELAAAKRLQYIQTNQHTQRYVYQVRISLKKEEKEISIIVLIILHYTGVVTNRD